MNTLKMKGPKMDPCGTPYLKTQEKKRFGHTNRRLSDNKIILSIVVICKEQSYKSTRVL